MAFNAGKWSPLLTDASAAALQGPVLAGTRSSNTLGTGTIEDFEELMNRVPADKLEAYLNYRTITPLINASLQQFDPAWRQKELEMQEELATKRGWKSLMFNQLGAGLENLTKGIAMSMNPYGTPEAARYSADMLAGSGDRLAAAYAAARNPMAIPAVQGGQAPTYF